MPDRRSRGSRPRRRGGRGRLGDRAAVQRHQQSVLDLHEALQSEVEALAEELPREDVVDRIRARARSLDDSEDVVEATLDEIFGLGPLEPLLRDADVRTIEVRGAELFAEGRPVDVGFRDEAHARSVIEQIVGSVGESLTPAGVTVTLLDGSTCEARLRGDVDDPVSPSARGAERGDELARPNEPESAYRIVATIRRP